MTFSVTRLTAYKGCPGKEFWEAITAPPEIINIAAAPKANRY